MYKAARTLYVVHRHWVCCVLNSVDNQLKYAKTQLDRLKKTNVFNTTFHIWLVSFIALMGGLVI